MNPSTSLKVEGLAGAISTSMLSTFTLQNTHSACYRLECDETAVAAAAAAMTTASTGADEMRYILMTVLTSCAAAAAIV